MNSTQGMPPPVLMPPLSSAPARLRAPAQGPGFAQILRDQVSQPQELRFSAHARQRLEERDIAFSPLELARVRDAVREVSAKGGREALFVLPHAALVVNVRNSTVITAVDTGELNHHVFTNIDSAVLIPSADSSTTD